MANSLPLFLILLQILLLDHFASVASLDPCFKAFHKQFPLANIGSRNEKCKLAATNHEICDHTLPEDWYEVAGSEMLNYCPVSGDCGVIYPIWMKGQFPKVYEGTVSRTACIKNGNSCCNKTLQIQIRNCSSYFVYYLKQPAECPTAYCFKSDRLCKPIHTSTTTANPDTKEKKKKCDSVCILIMIVVVVGTVLIATVATLGFMCKKEICFKKTKVNTSDTNIREPPPPYEVALETKGHS